MADICICARCHRATHIDALDAKPTPTLWLRILKLFRGQIWMLHYASDRGYEFNRLECGDCYGSGYESHAGSIEEPQQ